LVADGAADEIDPERLERELEPDVAHHGRDDGVALETALALQLTAAHQQHGVAVDDLSRVIDEDRAVAVAVERHTHATSLLDDRSSEQLGMGGAALQVDV